MYSITDHCMSYSHTHKVFSLTERHGVKQVSSRNIVACNDKKFTETCWIGRVPQRGINNAMGAHNTETKEGATSMLEYLLQFARVPNAEREALLAGSEVLPDERRLGRQTKLLQIALLNFPRIRGSCYQFGVRNPKTGQCA